MKQFEVVIVKLHGRSRDDEVALTDLLNERARAGWVYQSQAVVAPGRVMVVFARQA